MQHTVLFRGSLTTYWPFTVRLPDMPDTALPKYGNQHVIPANTFRQALRRATFDVIFDARGRERINLETARLQRQGGIVLKKSAKKEGDASGSFDIESFRESLRDPQISLWGAMSRHVPGKAYVQACKFDPDVQTEIVSFVRGDDFSRDPGLIDSLLKDGEDEKLMAQRDDDAKTAKARTELKALFRDIRKAVNGDDEAKAKELRERAAAVGEEQSSRQAAMKHPGLKTPVIQAGNKAASEIVLEGVNREEFALFMNGLLRWGRFPRLGGIKRHCGLVTFRYDVLLLGDDGFAKIGHVRTKGDTPYDGTEWKIDHPELGDIDYDFSTSHFEVA